MSRVDEKRRNAQHVVDALAALFTGDVPDTRHEAEAELREAGLDPLQVGRRFDRLAQIALGEPDSDVTNRPPLPISFNDGTLTRTPRSREHPGTAERPAASRTRGDSRRPPRQPQRWIVGRPLGAIAALGVVFVLGYLMGREHLSGTAEHFDPVHSAAPPAAQLARGKGKGADVLVGPGRETHREQPLAPTPDTADMRRTPAVPATSAPAEPAAPAGPGELAASAVEGDEAGSIAEAPRETTVEPGEVITRANVERVRGLISPGVEWCVRHGLIITIVPYRKVRWNAAYRQATLKYAGRTRLAADGRSLVGYVAGLPFPHLDPDDPQIALKIMWNYEYKPYVTDDSDLRNSDADSGSVTGTAPMQVERHFFVDHERTLAYTGRLYTDPKPDLPNPDNVREKTSRHPYLEPYDLKGVGLTSIRYLSPDRQDDTWLYLPSLRRVRRLSSSQRSDALFGQDADVDSDGGFAGPVSGFDWKYLGEKEVLAAFHAQRFPVRYCGGTGDFIFCDTWEPRKVYVIEGVPTLPQYAYGKRVLFIDKETYHIAYSDIYDRSGQLWKVWVNQWSFKKRATPSYGITYEDEMPFHPSVTMVDIQLNHATRAALPSAKFVGEEGWYFNQGNKSAMSEEFFTIAHLIESGH